VIRVPMPLVSLLWGWLMTLLALSGENLDSMAISGRTVKDAGG
jgi:hypothetical protein